MTPPSGNIAEILSRSARTHSHRVALRCHRRSTTYAELDALANRLAHVLWDLGARPGSRVGLLGGKSPEFVAATQAVLRLDGVYVPLDPRAPSARLATVCADCGVEVVVIDSAHSRSAPELVAAGVRGLLCLGDAPDVAVRTATRDDVARAPDTPLRFRRGGADLAYVLYTSGSTGRPKGVMITHENALTFIDWAAKHFALTPDDRILNLSPLTFDLAVFDLYNGFGAGAAVVLVTEADALFPAAVTRAVRAEGVTTVYMVPSTYVALMTRGGLLDLDPRPLRRLLYAGEAFPTPQLRRLRSWAPAAHLCNLYGPIETNVCTFHDVGELAPDADGLPIGRAIDGVTVELWGEDGEILVHGPCVTPGYWGDAELTRAKRLTAQGREWFRTGDLATRDASGDLWFRGRRDHLVKVRGFRVELGDVEAALLRRPGVVEAAAAAVPDADGGQALVAWYVCDGPVEASALKSHLAGQLPAYMIPRELFAVPSLPKTSSGKVSRRALVETHPDGKERSR